MLAELLVPIWAERVAPTLWHPEHIKERYGLFTIIVLGESILSASVAIQSAIQASDLNTDLATIITGGLLIVFSMWWLYFDQPEHTMLTSLRTAFIWGYSHLFIFAAAGAVGAGLSVEVDQISHHAAIDTVGAGATVAVPVVIYLICLWALHQQPQTRSSSHPIIFPLAALLIFLTPLSGQAVLLTGLLLTALVVIKVTSRYKAIAHADT